MAKSKRNVYQEVTNLVIKAMESGKFTNPKRWDDDKCTIKTTSFLPTNAVTNKAYNGINRLILFITASSENYTNNRWCTFNQAKKQGWRVRKGEKSMRLCYYSKYTKENEKGEDEERFFLKTFNVFNVAQLDGYEQEAEDKEMKPITESETLKKILKNTDVTIKPQGGTEAFYVPSLDIIQMPQQDAFKSIEAWTSTIFHELSHAVGHPKRLNRPQKSLKEDKEAYAREELVAELTSSFLCAEVGVISETLQFHASYLNSWLQVLKHDEKAIFKACSQAQKACDFMLKEWAGIEVNKYYNDNVA